MVFGLLTRLTLAVAACWIAACGPKALTVEDLNTRLVTLPDGFEVRAEVLTRPEDMARGMMFREELAEDRGMLFIHSQPGHYPYWMFQTLIPLDIIWMDQQGRVVEISADTPPCQGQASECPDYGGNTEALMVIELSAGSAEKHNVRVGSRLEM